MLLNNTLSSDKVMQQMYRCMTEAKNKKIGFVVDLNISRVINTCINYSICGNEQNIEDKINYIISNHLITIDIDIMKNKKIDSCTIVKKLMDIWKEDPVNNFKLLLKKLDNDFEDFDNDTQKLINKTFTKLTKGNEINIELKLNDETQELPKGKEKLRLNNETLIEEIMEEKMEEKKEEEIQISFTKDVLPCIIPLSCILTMKNKNLDFVKMLNEIKENEELLEIFDEQCLIWWNKKDLIDLIRTIVNRYFDKTSNTYNSSIQFKLSLQSLIDHPKELLELINDCLKPKETEKKQFGEVFTPMILINEMLDKLPSEVWKNKDFTWFDPANGMGNFPIAVYLRLMESLKEEITDEKERKKHILEKMLYMSELNKKNCLICSQIFDINREYKLNLYNGDSLSLNVKKQWNIDKFDIIMGNPPYNKDISKNNAKGQVLWIKFVDKFFKLLKKNKFLLFLHPPNYRKPNHELQKIFFSNRLIFIKMYNDLDVYKMFRCKTRIDYYLLQKTKNDNNFETIIIDEKGIENKFTITNNTTYIPNYGISIHNKLQRVNVSKFNCFNPRSHDTTRKFVSKNKSTEFCYKLLNTVSSFGKTFYYSSKIHPVQNINKVMFSNGRYIYPFYDDGKLGGTQSVIYIPVKDAKTGENIIRFLNTKLLKFLIKSTKFSNFAVSHEFINVIPNLSQIIDNITDEKINSYLHLTPDEIKIVSI
jgi:hypothetical protein